MNAYTDIIKDARAFDPDFEVDSLESFEPLMRKIFQDNPMAVGKTRKTLYDRY